MGILLLGIGLPASGKSTLFEAIAPIFGCVYLSVDEVRAELGVSHDNPVVRSDNQITIHIWDVIRERTRMTLSQGKSVIVDATFAKKELRTEFAELGRNAGATIVVGVFFNTPVDLCWQRCLLRERKVDRAVFDDRVRQFEENPPQVEDGFDYLISVIGGDSSPLEELFDRFSFTKK